jgi:hydrogenase-4 component F
MDTALILALILPPLAGATAAIALRRSTGRASWFNAVTMPVSLAAAGLLAARLASGAAPIEAWPFWRIDALSALFALLVSAVATLAVWLGPGLSAEDAADAQAVRTFRIYANFFAATMLLAVSTSSLGLMWVAIEASTVAAALLIPLRRSRASIDASWKFLIIGSVGIALAFAGTVLAFVDYTAMGGSTESALEWTTLLAAAPRLHPEVMRLAFAFLLVGFGTKAGLVPMHTWLPDAHSEAPAPLSAMMSGVLLAVALYALARWKVIVEATTGSGFTDTLLLVAAAVTILVGSLSLAAQQQYKRLLAYSSIEHTGLACFGLALGPLGTAAALLHLTGHALAKSTAFLVAGRILSRYRRSDIASASGLLTALPASGTLFGASLVALAGLPPFGLFLSEVLLLKAGWVAGHHALTLGVMVLILIAFAALVRHGQAMLLGLPPEDVVRGERAGWAAVALGLPLAALVWIGIWLPDGFRALLERAAAVLHP